MPGRAVASISYVGQHVLSTDFTIVNSVVFTGFQGFVKCVCRYLLDIMIVIFLCNFHGNCVYFWQYVLDTPKMSIIIIFCNNINFYVCFGALIMFWFPK